MPKKTKEFVDQTNTDPVTGDCFVACLRNLLGSDLIGMPTFHNAGNWLSLYNDELADRFKTKTKIASIRYEDMFLLDLPIRTMVIVTVDSQMHPETTHAVLCQEWEDGCLHLIHDPNPTCRMDDLDFACAVKHWCFFAVKI